MPPANLPVRPTTDMAREGLFNILNNYLDFEECTVLDLFAGTGAVSVEFVSRGVREAFSVDRNASCVNFIRSTAERLNLANLHAVRADAFEFIKGSRRGYDLVFADPPYDLENVDTLPDLVLEGGLLADEGFFILEHSEQHDYADHPAFWQMRRYGKVHFTFFHKATEADA